MKKKASDNKKMRKFYKCLEDKINYNINNELNRKEKQLCPIEIKECNVCLDLLTKENMHTNECGHTFCIDCVKKHITQSINDNNLNISCMNATCKTIYSLTDIHEIVTFETFEKYKKFAMKNNNATVQKKKIK